MRLAVFSDIHGNLEAFGAVLADAEGIGCDQMACLGDAVGYGPDSQAVLELLRRRQMPCVLGNHEWGLVDKSRLKWFNPPAREALLMTAQDISPANLEFIAAWPRHLEIGDCRLVHGCPPDEVTTYIFELGPAELEKRIRKTPQPLCLVGHTHELELIGLAPRGLQRQALTRGVHALQKGWRYLMNVGSVGQPRDGDPHAKYLVYDAGAKAVELRFVPYDIAATQAKIRAQGLPEYNASRLGRPIWDDS